jgi:hypothetical protein
MDQAAADLIRAVQELEDALEAFAAAHEAWSAKGLDGTEALIEALARAEARLDAARHALLAAEGRLRA